MSAMPKKQSVTAKAEVNVTLGMTKYSDKDVFEVVNTSRHKVG